MWQKQLDCEVREPVAEEHLAQVAELIPGKSLGRVGRRDFALRECGLRTRLLEILFYFVIYSNFVPALGQIVRLSCNCSWNLDGDSWVDWLGSFGASFGRGSL